VPLEPVVADCVTVLRLAVVSVKVTLAPGAGVPPYRKVAAIGTVLLRV